MLEGENVSVQQKQRAFRKFHDHIKSDDNGTLRAKRKLILDRLKRNLPAPFNRFRHFNQGSYAMATGITPLKGREQDIDVGLILPIDMEKYNPVAVKKLILQAAKPQTKRVIMRSPVVTVFYASGYHVDLAVYAQDTYKCLHLAVGRLQSNEEHTGWIQSEPKDFIKEVQRRFSGWERDQFRRTIRYLKRWKDLHFSQKGNAAPTGIALTVAAYHWFKPEPDNDLTAVPGKRDV